MNIAASYIPRIEFQPFDRFESVQPSRYRDCADYLTTNSDPSPVFLFSPRQLQRTASKFIDGFPGQVSYAVKANPHPLVLNTLGETGIQQYDVASMGEIRLMAGSLPGAQLNFNNPIRSQSAIQEAYTGYGVRSFVVDDERGLGQVLALSVRDIEVTVRFKLEHQNAAYDFGSKFGATPAQAVKLLETVVAHGARASMTFHPGSQCTDHQVYAHYIETAAEIAARAKVEISRLNVGGGFPACYPGSEVAPLLRYFETIGDTFSASFGVSDVQLLCEPGRAMVADCISLLTEVIHVRENGEVFLNDGYYGGLQEQAYLPEHLVVRVWRDGQIHKGKSVPRTVFGPTCDPIDKMVRPVKLPLDIQPGDRVEFGLLGAYGSATSTDFNGFDRADYACVDQGMEITTDM